MIELIIINSLIIWGVFASIQEGFIFDKLGNWMRREWEEIYNPRPEVKYPVRKSNLPSWIKKPLATCPICMSSVYGTPVFWLAYFTNLINYDFIFIVYICYIFAIAGLNYLILSFIPEGKSDDKEYKQVTINEAEVRFNSIGNELNEHATQGWVVSQTLKKEEVGGTLKVTYILERNK